MNTQRTPRIIDMVNGLVRTSRQMMAETGHEPTPEELAQELTLPLETVHKLLEIARKPIALNG